MKEESNHLIEYYTVMKKAGKMIFGETAVNRPSFGNLISDLKSPKESELLGHAGPNAQPSGFESDNSEENVFGSGDNCKSFLIRA